MNDYILKSPFPYFGGKSRVADLVWSRLSDVRNYIEPFAGSLAVLLRRPADHAGKVETLNDSNHFIANFWRAVQTDHAEVAKYADWPVSEADLHARHRWLMQSDAAAEFVQRMSHNPDAYDSKIAGWWVWGQCCWIGGGWCSGNSRIATPDTLGRPSLKKEGVTSESKRRPITNLGNSRYGVGVHGQSKRVRLSSFDAAGCGVNKPIQKIPQFGGDAGAAGRGVVAMGRPQLGDVYDIGRGVLSNIHAGSCAERRAWLTDWMQRLADRLRLVRTCYGDWSRICSSRTTTTRIGLTGVFLDPPYAKDVDRMHEWLNHLQGDGDAPTEDAGESQRHTNLYANDKSQDVDHMVARVLHWCMNHGNDNQMRIALCGYDGEHNILERRGWQVEAWKAHGGYANRNADNNNKDRERIWFSPACVQRETEATLFGEAVKSGKMPRLALLEAVGK